MECEKASRWNSSYETCDHITIHPTQTTYNNTKNSIGSKVKGSKGYCLKYVDSSFAFKPVIPVLI